MWAVAEREAVRASLGSYFYRQQLPGKAAIMKCLENPVLHGRSWRNVKDYVRNVQQKNSEFTLILREALEFTYMCLVIILHQY